MQVKDYTGKVRTITYFPLVYLVRILLFNNVQSITHMPDTGFTCPKCDYSFPTAEQVAEHLRNEHVDGAQTETTKQTT
jgi:thiol-disulfide isomerase/thioredoxin